MPIIDKKRMGLENIVPILDGWINVLEMIVRNADPSDINKNSFYMWHIDPLKKDLNYLISVLKERGIVYIGDNFVRIRGKESTDEFKIIEEH